MIRREHLGRAATFVLVAVAYVVAAEFGFSLAFSTRQVTAIWPPTGIALAALLIGGRRMWPAIFAGALIVNATRGEPLVTAAGIALGNTLGPLLVWFLLRRARFERRLARTR